MSGCNHSISQVERRLIVLGHVVVSDERYEAMRSATRRLLDGWKQDIDEKLWWRNGGRTSEPMTEGEWLWLQDVR